MKALKLNNWHNGYVHVYTSIMGELVFFKSIDYDEFSNTAYEGYYDVFQSQNTFKSAFSRIEENLLQLRMLYIDIGVCQANCRMLLFKIKKSQYKLY